MPRAFAPSAVQSRGPAMPQNAVAVAPPPSLPKPVVAKPTPVIQPQTASTHIVDPQGKRMLLAKLLTAKAPHLPGVR